MTRRDEEQENRERCRGEPRDCITLDSWAFWAPASSPEEQPQASRTRRRGRSNSPGALLWRVHDDCPHALAVLAPAPYGATTRPCLPTPDARRSHAAAEQLSGE